MIFSRSRSELPGPLLLCNKDIERKSESKFLGVILDEKLTWASHIIAVKSKMSRYIGVMCKVKKFYLSVPEFKFSTVLLNRI